MFRLAFEALPEFRVLRGNADGAGVQVALAHHDAARRDQWCRGKTDFISAQECCNQHVAAGANATIGLHCDATPEVVGDKSLLGFCKADFPWGTRMLDRRQW